MKEYFEIKENTGNVNRWLLEYDTINETFTKEVGLMNNDIIRKAPSNSDNYGSWTDNYHISIDGIYDKIKRTIHTIILELDDNNMKRISSEMFFSYWNK